MKKHSLLIPLLLLPSFSLTTMAQDKASGIPAIKVVTQGKQDEGKLLTFSAYTQKNGFYVDYGNGNTIEYPWAGTVVFSDRTYGDTIKIYSLSADDPIQTFSCKNDSLKDITLNEPALIHLDVSGNLLQNIDLSKNSALQKVWAAKNQLVVFKFPEGVNLTYVDLSQNKLEAIDLSGSTKLEYLDASVNNLRAPVSLKWPESKAMKHFDVSCNNFFNLDNIPSYPELEFLAANHNKLSTVDLGKYPKLQALKVQYNTNLSSLRTSVCPDLKYIDVTGTKLTALSLEQNEKLETLKASLLALGSLDLTNLPELKDITVEKSGLKDVDFSANTKLQRVDVAGNELTDIDFTNNPVLSYLDCSSNKLSALDMAQLSKVDTLNCSINNIEELDLTKSQLLQNLNCSSNSISALNLSASKALRNLNCNDNKLNALSFSKQLDIESVSVKSNNMSKDALEVMFSSLPDINGMEIDQDDALWKGVVKYANNPGSETADATVLEAKGWKTEQTADALGDASAMAVISPDQVGTKYMFAIDCAADMMIDWGDGVKMTYKYDPNNGSYQNIEGVLKGTNLKIYAPEATDFGIANNSVTQLNVSNMPKLKHLSCSGNAITELDVSKNTMLEQFTCSNNPLTYINFGEAKSLKTLYCENTQVKDLDFSNCSTLEYLDLQKNRLQSINLKGCTNLKTLDATYNDLTEVDLSASTELTTFFADKNQLKSLDLSNNLQLENLSVGVNQLEKLDVSQLKWLVYLYCNDNKLTELKPVSSSLKVLQTQNNKIGSLDLSECVSLVELAANSNQLTSVDLSNCTLLQRLWLNDNKLSSITVPEDGMPKLGVLNIANNEFESFNFSIAPWASQIVASGNKLSGTVDLTGCKSVESFYASDNAIEKINFSGSGITTLIVNNNKLKSLDPKSSALYWLEAKNNELAAVNISYGDNLYLAHLDNNKLNSLNMKNKNKIISLSLRGNQFEDNALDRIYEQLPDLSGVEVSSEYSSWMKWLLVEGNPGAETANSKIVTDKGWNIDVLGTSGIDNISADNGGLCYDSATGKLMLNGKAVTAGRIASVDGTSDSIDLAGGNFNINNLPHGIYVISVVADGKTYVKKIMK